MRLALWPPASDAPCPDTPSLAGMPPPQPLVLQRLCSKFRLSLLVLVFNVLLLVAICVTGSQSEGRRGGAAVGARASGTPGGKVSSPCPCLVKGMLYCQGSEELRSSTFHLLSLDCSLIYLHRLWNLTDLGSKSSFTALLTG